jgi:hypothetical protein
MQPVGMILEAVEGVKGRYPRGLVTPQSWAIWVKVPSQRHGADRQPCARGGGVAVAPRVEQPILLVQQPVDGSRRAVCLRTSIGRGKGDPPPTVRLA